MYDRTHTPTVRGRERKRKRKGERERDGERKREEEREKWHWKGESERKNFKGVVFRKEILRKYFGRKKEKIIEFTDIKVSFWKEI